MFGSPLGDTGSERRHWWVTQSGERECGYARVRWECGYARVRWAGRVPCSAAWIRSRMLRIVCQSAACIHLRSKLV